ncbi:MAG: DEAD/DEAH box helicase [Polyangiaceae bacterium]|nr:DEAD/DEAH box helicase [Polyangiaceae bacterium]
MGLTPALTRALQEEGYTHPTPIQARAIPALLDGRDLIGVAQTGTGKTAAFALPILQRLAAQPRPTGLPVRCLVLSPTRELAAQIGESFTAYGRHTGVTNTVIFGGVGQDAQVKALRRGVDVLVATPGRLLDLLDQRLLRLDGVSVLVLDEADRMLDMGFLRDVKRVVAALPRQRQTLLFSATMPREIQELATSMLVSPVRVEVTPVSSTAERIAQSVYLCDKSQKRALLERVLSTPDVVRALVFTRTKHGANRVAEVLEKAGIGAAAIHGNKSQGARERALAGFKAGTTRVLVATDIAARGIDVDGVSHVVNFELPNVPETYVHRIGRTARAEADGVAVSLCDGEERVFLRDIERLTRREIPRVAVPADLPKRDPMPERPPLPPRGGRPQHGGHGGGRQQQGGHGGGRTGGGRPGPRGR